MSSKYSYDQKRQVNKQNERLAKGDKSGLDKSTNKKSASRLDNISHKRQHEEEYDEESSESDDLPRGNPHASVGDKVQRLNRMNNNVGGRK